MNYGRPTFREQATSLERNLLLGLSNNTYHLGNFELFGFTNLIETYTVVLWTPFSKSRFQPGTTVFYSPSHVHCSLQRDKRKNEKYGKKKHVESVGIKDRTGERETAFSPWCLFLTSSNSKSGSLSSGPGQRKLTK